MQKTSLATLANHVAKLKKLVQLPQYDLFVVNMITDEFESICDTILNNSILPKPVIEEYRKQFYGLQLRKTG